MVNDAIYPSISCLQYQIMWLHGIIREIVYLVLITGRYRSVKESSHYFSELISFRKFWCLPNNFVPSILEIYLIENLKISCLASSRWETILRSESGQTEECHRIILQIFFSEFTTSPSNELKPMIFPKS